MRANRSGIAPGLFVFAWFCVAPWLMAAEAKLPSPATSPARLVQAALESELAEPSELRGDLLKQALALDPDYAPARWQSGFVRWDGQWLTPEEVATRAKSDPLLAAYRERRDALVDRAEDHSELAIWCHKNKLTDQEHVHWLKVLEFEQDNSQALAGLGLRWHEGRLLTDRQIQQAKLAAAAQRQATGRWQPQMIKWRRAIDSGIARRRDAALAELAKVSDASALPALEAVFAATGDSKKALELNRVYIDSVSRIPGLEATAALLRAALVPDSPAQRALAADALKKRPPHAYIPQLIAMLPGTLSTKFEITILPNGTVVHEHQLQLNGRSATISFDFSATGSSDVAGAGVLIPVAMNKEFGRATAIESQARATQDALDRRRQRVQFVLHRTTGMADVSDPAIWEKMYNDYNGWVTPASSKPEYYQSFVDTYGYTTTPTIYTATNPTPPQPARFSPQMLARERAMTGHTYCFPAGTTVLTAYGPRPIENLSVGDGVFAQDPQTGELQIKAVQTRTLRPKTPLLKLELGADTIFATPGHPFWVVGEGWRTAKNLKKGDRLHALHGSATLEAIGSETATEVYNLIVCDTHNYFVGSSLLLAHDNSPPVESAASVPGLALQSSAAQER